ncbi:hypothetical protein [Sanguibacter sp. Z1732]|uniref:hypothetical protein n=1 Tax=Sanguibacter sp. Z1732 TaxID=3435412 RepID=UPI003D9CB5D6
MFANRRGLVVGPQKTGKSPWGASITAFEAVGPCIFAGWAEGGEVYRCEDHGCSCGWSYVYEPGEPMGIPRPMSTIQLLATAEDQTDNVYRPLQEMIRRGPLSEQMKVREGFIRTPNNGRIDPITSAPNSKLGNPIHFALADESGLYGGENGAEGSNPFAPRFGKGFPKFSPDIRRLGAMPADPRCWRDANLELITMTSGGRRNRSGPKADEESGRSDRRGYSLTALPAEGYDGAAPEFPLMPRRVLRWEHEDKRRFQVVDDEMTALVADREQALWEWAWSTPQACAWSMPSEMWRIHTIAMWVRTFVICESDEPRLLTSRPCTGSLIRSG